MPNNETPQAGKALGQAQVKGDDDSVNWYVACLEYETCAMTLADATDYLFWANRGWADCKLHHFQERTTEQATTP